MAPRRRPSRLAVASLAAGALLATAAGAVALVACGSGDFLPQSLVNSVRVFAVRLDAPYARPGETVRMDLLSYDGRADKPRPAVTYWLPFVCVNPADDAYYACFSQFAGADAGAAAHAPVLVAPGSTSIVDGGADGGATADAGGGAATIPSAADLAALLRPGVDLTPIMTTGDAFSFALPADVVTSHPAIPGAVAPYGVAIAFNVTCAGHVELVPTTTSDGVPNVQSPPLGCFDDAHNRLGPDDYVFGYARVYAYDDLRNANPVLDRVTFDGATIDPAAGVAMARCTSSKQTDCPKHEIGVVVPPSSQEARPDPGASGALKEEIWAAFSTTAGKFGSDARVLYDPVSGAVPGSENDFYAPAVPGTYRMWIVVRDNRAGAAWVEFPFVVQ